MKMEEIELTKRRMEDKRIDYDAQLGQKVKKNRAKIEEDHSADSRILIWEFFI